MTDDCVSDYVEFQFWNTSTNTWSRVGDRKCGRTVPETVLSPMGRTRVVFKSNQNINGDGFTINWSLDCGGVFESSSGFFTSPGYPDQYNNNLNCNYTIRTSGPDFIAATFEETFEIEQGRFGCNYDRVEILEESSNSSRGSYCGDENPDPVSTRGDMIVNFKTDGSVVKKGTND